MKLEQDFIPESNSNRPGTRLAPTHITVHETANTSRGANAEMHARYVKGVDAQAREVSWHVTIDDSKAIQHLPFNEIGWHAGREGNHTSIGIEVCVNTDGDFLKARGNAISVIRQLASTLEIHNNNIVTHQHWTGKNCPDNLLKEWSKFKDDLKTKADDHPKHLGMELRVIANSLWVYDKPDWNARYKTVNNNEVLTIKEELIVNGSKMYRLKSGLFITANASYIELI